MDVVGSEIGQKMRSAIKAKLTELGCYVDDELPDYVMVMVANKRTRAQMEDDLQLFLGDNTELFVNWLHQVLKKLQEVTVAAPKLLEPEKVKEKEKSHSKEKKAKEKKSKDKPKKSNLKKAKKKEKEKEKSLRKKEQKKAHKKKKAKDQMIRPNIPPLLMNMEKESEPSITDVFAGQILKNHGILIESVKEDPIEIKPTLNVPEAKRPILPIIDPATILATPSETKTAEVTEERRTSVSSGSAPRDNQLKEMNEIEAKIQGLRQKLAEQLDSMSEDEDFLNIRTEAEELMNDFAEDVFQEISEQTPVVSTPPTVANSPNPPPLSPKPITPKEPIETLPQIELNLPKRPIRERLGAREEQKKPPEKQNEDRRPSKSPERSESFTPERELEPRPSSRSAKSRIGPVESKRKSEFSSEKMESSSKRLTSRVSVLEARGPGARGTCASVVRVRPRPRAPVPASSLLLRAVADAHKSLVNLPPKMLKEPATVKRAMVLPMRRVDSQAIYMAGDDDAHDAISLGEPDSDDDKSSKVTSDAEKDEYVPTTVTKKNPNEYGPLPLSKKIQNEYAPGLTMKIQNTEYLPSRRLEGRTASRKDDSIVIEAINIHNPTVGKDKNTQFIVTMDGFNPNAFLAKKLQTEGLLNDENEDKSKPDETNKLTDTTTPTEKEPPKTTRTEATKEKVDQKRRLSDSSEKSKASEKSIVSEKSKASEKSIVSEKSKASENSDAIATEVTETKVIVKLEKIEKRKSESSGNEESPPVKKRKSSPIVFDVGKKEKDKEPPRERTESAGSDNHVTVTTTASSHKFDSLPPLSAAPGEKKAVWCRAFPQCRYGAGCAFLHPRCRFAAACTRRGCPYAHAHAPQAAPAPQAPAPLIASHVVPAANFKSISAAPAVCKYYPSCVNPGCLYYHPKPCRYGKLCANKLDCSFYHADVPAKWRYSGP